MSTTLTSKLLTDATVTAIGSAVEPASEVRTFQASVDGTGAVTAVVAIEVTNESDTDHNNSPSASAHWLTSATISLSGTTSASDGFTASAAWRFTRANLTSISGTGAKVNVTMGVKR